MDDWLTNVADASLSAAEAQFGGEWPRAGKPADRKRPRSESRQRRKIVAIRVNGQEQAILTAEMRRTGKPAAALFRAAFFEAIAARREGQHEQ